ncbi:hypothetical protein AVEN_101209-1 [Araneus ventricosus]|uniref:Uncharacterized protein n=1 Tax=Araneus ventricosus TaxID=182803 RepID=A0A4Y2K7E5_ARAVE|nr:hypothetical protein AVEN_101209-1 [Araneus ventricosus]
MSLPILLFTSEHRSDYQSSVKIFNLYRMEASLLCEMQFRRQMKTQVRCFRYLIEMSLATRTLKDEGKQEGGCCPLHQIILYHRKQSQEKRRLFTDIHRITKFSQF